MNVFDRVISFLKSWLLPTAMCLGAAISLLFAEVSCLAPAKPHVLALANILLPVLIFTMLFLTFCRIDVKEMKPRRWHVQTLALQTGLCLAGALIIMFFMKPGSFAELVAEGVLACLLSPTATAAAVVTGKLGGNAASLTSYTLESNILSAVLITVICPLIHPIAGLHMLTALTVVMLKVSELLILPFVTAIFVKHTFPRLHQRLISHKNLPFYIWGCTLTLVMGMTMRVVFAHLDRPLLETGLIIGALLVCLFKFATGRLIGRATGKVDSISAGQALGQKNTSFTIWMALTYLNPIAAIAPGSYVIWQNIINSWELWEKAREDRKAAEKK